MAESAGWAPFFPVFLRYGLLPEPPAVRTLREEGSAELAAIAGEIARTKGERNLTDLEKKYEACVRRYETAIGVERQKIENYVPWAFACDDPWKRVAISQMIEREEPGFSFAHPPADTDADRDFHRRSLMESILLVARRKEAGVTAAAPMDVKQAAAVASKEIGRRFSNGEMSYGRPPSAGTLRDLWCRQNRGARGGKPGEYLPSYIETHRAIESHFLDLLEAANHFSPRD